MMMPALTCLVLALAPVVADDAPAAKERTAMLAPFDRLQRNLDAPNLRILDVRSKEAYDAGHIPGAVWVDHAEVEKVARAPGALEDRDAWAAWIEPLGIGPDTAVLVYDDNRQKDAARIWWLLSYLGVEKVGLVDGNFALWKEQGRPVATEATQVDPHTFPVALKHQRKANRNDVLEAIQSASKRIIDARSAGEFDGTQILSSRGGHIPEACHLEWSEFVDDQGQFQPPAKLQELVSKAGVKPGEAVITHCQGGGRASVDAFVFELLGFEAANYYPGWSDWGNAADVPIENESK